MYYKSPPLVLETRYHLDQRVFGPGSIWTGEHLDWGAFGPGSIWTGEYLDWGAFGPGSIWLWRAFVPGSIWAREHLVMGSIQLESIWFLGAFGWEAFGREHLDGEHLARSILPQILWVFLGIPVYLWVSLGISGYLWVSLGISWYLWVSLGQDSDLPLHCRTYPTLPFQPSFVRTYLPTPTLPFRISKGQFFAHALKYSIFTK